MRLRRRKRTKDRGRALSPAPRELPGLRPKADEPADPTTDPGSGEPQEVLDPAEPVDRRQRHEFLSGRKMKHPEEAADPLEEEAVTADGVRLVVKGGGMPLAPEPRRAAAESGKPTDAADDQSSEPGVLRLERDVQPLPRSQDVAVEAVATGKPKTGEEDTWTKQQQRVSWRWSLVVAGGMVVAVVSALAIVQLLSVVRRGEGVRVVPLVELEVERIDLGEGAALLDESPGVVFAEACEVLEGYTAARSAGEAQAWVRVSDRQVEDLAAAWHPWSSPPFFERRELIQYALMNFQQPPFIVLWGLCEDFTPFRAYLVREDGRMRIDWRATEGFSDVPLGLLPATESGSAITLRCLLEPKPFHTSALPEDRYRSFLLSGADVEKFVWGYVERESPLERRLMETLNKDASFLDDKTKERATLRVAIPEQRDRDNQVLITEMLHIEWVSP